MLVLLHYLSDPDNVFDVRKNVAMVPMFRETEIESRAAGSSEERQERVVEPQPGGLTPWGEDSGDRGKPYTLPRFDPLSTSPGSMGSARVKMRCGSSSAGDAG